MPETVLIEEMTWPNVRAALDAGKTTGLLACGSVILELGDPSEESIRLEAGDAALIHDDVPHRVRNSGPVPAQLVWSAAPGWGRSVLPGRD